MPRSRRSTLADVKRALACGRAWAPGSVLQIPDRYPVRSHSVTTCMHVGTKISVILLLPPESEARGGARALRCMSTIPRIPVLYCVHIQTHDTHFESVDVREMQIAMSSRDSARFHNQCQLTINSRSVGHQLHNLGWYVQIGSVTSGPS